VSVSRASAPLLLAAAMSLACAKAWWLHLPPRLGACPGPTPSTASLPAGDFVWHDRARYRGGAVDVGFSLVAEKRGERLVLVGLNSFGARAFSLTQEAERIEADLWLGRALQVPPETVLRDWYALRAANAAPAVSLELTRPECGYTASFVAESSRSLSASASP
jgi:hypothetical protein